ncbi:MAG TPA: hypothetical protein VLA74_10890 [Nitrososphaeraceae archaeon]|nr:hypothetical protein [Nitrososphaeraceae archaeon]
MTIIDDMEDFGDASSHDNILDLTPYENFIFALKSSETRRQYPKLLKIFLDFINIDKSKPIEERADVLYKISIENRKWLESQIFRYVKYYREKVEKREISAGTLKNYLKVVKLFCRMNDLEDQIHWYKIKIGMPKVKEYADDRAPTLDEIRKLVDYPDIRIKPIVHTMMSSGIRLGAWDYLKWKHIIPYISEKNGEILGAKIIVYAREPEEYYSFITPEAFISLKEWMQLRERHGENITGESWVLRDLWETSNTKYGDLDKQASNPSKFNSTGVKTMLSRAWHHQGVWTVLKDGEKRHEFKLAHGFRKFFETQTQKVMNHNNIKILMGHSSSMGLSKNYYKPTEKEVLENYLHAIHLLTVNEENKLKKKVKELTEKSKDDDYIIRSKLLERDEQINSLRSELCTIRQIVDKIMSSP